MRITTSTERRALLAATQGLARAERLHLLVRFTSCPWHRVVPVFDRDASLADVGCGPGLFAFLLSRAGFTGRYLGVDPDERKVERARRFPGEDDRFRFATGSVEALPEAGFGQVAILDVLYLVPPEARQAFVDGAARALAPGGQLVAVTSGGGPGWKRALDRLQERAAVRLLGLTRGASVAPCDGAEIAGLLGRAGLSRVETQDVGSGYSHGFELVRGVREGAAAAP